MEFFLLLLPHCLTDVLVEAVASQPCSLLPPLGADSLHPLLLLQTLLSSGIRTSTPPPLPLRSPVWASSGSVLSLSALVASPRAKWVHGRETIPFHSSCTLHPSVDSVLDHCWTFLERGVFSRPLWYQEGGTAPLSTPARPPACYGLWPCYRILPPCFHCTPWRIIIIPETSVELTAC